MRAIARCATIIALALASVSARADEPRSEAAERFDRALRLVNAGDLSGGLAEFQRAYTLVPSPVLLYNIGLVEAALNRPVESVRALDKALGAPGSLKPENIARARSVLDEQRNKIGQVVLTTNVKDGVVEVDNIEIGKVPLAGPIDVASGSHVVAVVSPGYAPRRQQVTVASRASVTVSLELIAIEGRLAHVAVKSRVPAADVLVDGDPVGKTPLEATVTVTPGTHHVAVRRAGYVSAERDITLQDGSTGELALGPTIDRSALSREGGFLAITASEDQAVLTVDGEGAGVVRGPIELPAGPHRVRIERGGFLPADRDVVVPLGATKTITVTFEPTPDTRARYVSAAESRRLWSWVTIGSGAAIAAAGATLALVEQGQLTSAQSNLDSVNALWVRGSGRQCDFTLQLTNAQIGSCQSLLNDASNRVDNARVLTTVGWIGAGVGAAVLVTGVVLLATGDNPHKYDLPPSSGGLASVTVGPATVGRGAVLTLTGRF